MKIKLLPIIGAAIIGLALTATPAAAQVKWNGQYKYDVGIQPALAVHPSGLVLEFHRTQGSGNTLWYHVGRIKGTTVAWGGSQRAPGTGSWPNVAITPDGYVLYIWSGAEHKSMSTLYYAVGKIDPNGDENQSIQWLIDGRSFDAGFHSSLAMNAYGVIVETHESGTGGKGMYYRVGHLVNPAHGGNYDLVWDSGSNGRHYDDGINPHIAINNNNQVVEVHQVSMSESLLHYRRGTVLSNGTIDFRASQRYDNKAEDPTVVLLDDGQVLETHYESAGDNATSCPGRLSLSQPDRIDWYNRVGAAHLNSIWEAAFTSLTTDGTQPGPHIAIGAWWLSNTDDNPSPTVHYATATLPEAQ
jgi:hypothetical protein